MASNGFFPCFSDYNEKQYPKENVYKQNGNLEKLKRLVSSVLECCSTQEIKQAVGHDVTPIRPDSQEGKRLMKQFSVPYPIYRIDYGNTPFRIVFGLFQADRTVRILAIDTNHSTYSGKHRK